MSKTRGMTMASLMSIFILAVVGLSLSPTIQNMVGKVIGVGEDNFTGAALNLMKLFPLFWVILMIAIPIVGIYAYFRG